MPPVPITRLELVPEEYTSKSDKSGRVGLGIDLIPPLNFMVRDMDSPNPTLFLSTVAEKSISWADTNAIDASKSARLPIASRTGANLKFSKLSLYLFFIFFKGI